MLDGGIFFMFQGKTKESRKTRATTALLLDQYLDDVARSWLRVRLKDNLENSGAVTLYCYRVCFERELDSNVCLRFCLHLCVYFRFCLAPAIFRLRVPLYRFFFSCFFSCCAAHRGFPQPCLRTARQGPEKRTR